MLYQINSTRVIFAGLLLGSWGDICWAAVIFAGLLVRFGKTSFLASRENSCPLSCTVSFQLSLTPEQVATVNHFYKQTGQYSVYSRPVLYRSGQAL